TLLLGSEAGDTHREDVRRTTWRLWTELAGVTIEHTNALDPHCGGSFDRGVPGEYDIVFVNGDGPDGAERLEGMPHHAHVPRGVLPVILRIKRQLAEVENRLRL